MKLSASLLRFTKWFHIFGQSCYPPLTDGGRSGSSRSFHIVLNYLPSFLVLLMTSAFTIIAIVDLIIYKKPSDHICGTGCIILIANLVITLISISTSIIQGALHSKSYELLFMQIADVEEVVRKEYVFDHKAFRSYFFKYAFVIIGSGLMTFIAAIMSSFAQNLTWKSFIFAIFFLILRTVALMSKLQCVFYIGFYDFMLKSFVHYLSERGHNNLFDSVDHGRRNQSIKDELDHFKLLHFKLWTIGKTIKQIFGWALTVILFHNFVHALLCSFRVILTLDSRGISSDMLRKSFWLRRDSRNSITIAFYHSLNFQDRCWILLW